MQSLSPPRFVFAVVLSFLAGAVDGIGFSLLGGLFVSFMSGNSTRAGVFMASGDVSRALDPLALVGSFVCGAGLGASLGRIAGRWRPSTILFTEAVLLGICAAELMAGKVLAEGCVMALAMGVENATFMRSGRTHINLTFMTGALVQVGQGLSDALFGGPRWGWVRYAVLWFALASGALTGATLFRAFGVPALWLPAGIATAVGILLGSIESASGE